MALPRVSSPPTSSELSPSADQTRWFAEELQPHEPALRAYLHRKFPTLADVDDFVQESFLKAYLAHRDGPADFGKRISLSRRAQFGR